MMKLIYSGGLTLLLLFPAAGKPGETYTLTGNEKSIKAIIKADVEKYPELYESVSLKEYLAEFKKTNKVGKAKLSPGDELTFPETKISRKLRETREAEEAKAAAVAKEKRAIARRAGLDCFQYKFLPGWIYTTDNIPARFENGIPEKLRKQAAELVDPEFAETMKLHAYPARCLFIIEFDEPANSSDYFFVAFTDEENCCYTLEKGVTVFGTGEISSFCKWQKEGTEISHIKIGGRDYTDLKSFVAEMNAQ